MAENVELLQTFRFAVNLTRSDQGANGATLGDGAFSECSGLTLEADVKEYLEGGNNDGVVRRVGRVKLVPIVLKRGMFRQLADPPGTPQTPGRSASKPSDRADTALWDWLTGMVTGVLPIPRYNGQIQLKDPSFTRVLATWSFERGLPQKVTGPTLNAKSGEIAVEELQIVHEGLRMDGPGT